MVRNRWFSALTLNGLCFKRKAIDSIMDELDIICFFDNYNLSDDNTHWMRAVYYPMDTHQESEAQERIQEYL